MAFVVQTGRCDRCPREVAGGVDCRARLEHVDLVACALVDTHLNRVASGAATRTARDLQPSGAVEIERLAFRLLVVAQSPEVVLKVL
jgi:hypothetical protein